MPGPRTDIERAWRELFHYLQGEGVQLPEGTRAGSSSELVFSYAEEVILTLNDLQRRQRLRSFDVRLIRRAMRAFANHLKERS